MGKASLFSLLTLFAERSSANMIPRTYQIANGDPSSGSFSTEYRAEFFDVYSHPIRTQYSEVYWTMQDPVPIPEEIMQRFSGGKVMAVVGYEADQVRRLEDGTELPVPITWAYNHHYGVWLVKQSEALQDSLQKNYRDHSYQWETSDDSAIPDSLFFSEANGGEFRASFHGYPKGYAQLIESPDFVHFSPMQIDTWNRTMGNTTVYHPGPLPRASRIPHSAGYSGLIECPCSDRMEKKWHMSYSISDCRDGAIENATECLEAARRVVTSNEYALHDGGRASKDDHSCALEQHADGRVDVFWNQEDNSAAVETDSSVVAFSAGEVNLTVILTESRATLTFVGPSDKWFGVGFGTSAMCIHRVADECPEGGAYAITVSGDTVMERKLDPHGPGRVLTPNLSIESNTVDGEIRSVVLSRPLSALSDDHFTFDIKERSLAIIAARGCGLEFQQHCSHGSTELSFIQLNRRTSLCRAGIKGTIGGTAFSNNRCAEEPRSDLIRQGNPTCKIQTYRGGLNCCHHLESLLDKDQQIPWKDQYLEYRLKFRFYFEEYTARTKTEPPSHQHLTRLYWQTESYAGEYDVPQCQNSTPPDQCIHTITSRFTLREAIYGSVNTKGVKGATLAYAGPHCHAPTCISMELHNVDTGELLCKVKPTHGSSNVLYDEHGFLAIPPCLWGYEKGLVNPKYLSMNTTLLSIKHNNSTLPHTGEMASWQMRGVLIRDLNSASYQAPQLRRSEEGAA